MVIPFLVDIDTTEGSCTEIGFLKPSKSMIILCVIPLSPTYPLWCTQTLIHQELWHFNRCKWKIEELDWIVLIWSESLQSTLLRLTSSNTVPIGHIHSGRSHSSILSLLAPVSAGCTRDAICHLSGHSFLRCHHHSSGHCLFLCTGKLDKTKWEIED